jgi:NAD+ synthase (glutamine-hydrolysing)
MGLNFDELETFGKLRKIHRLGPVSMFRRLLPMWKHLKPEAIAEKVKKFFRYYAINRHK